MRNSAAPLFPIRIHRLPKNIHESQREIDRYPSSHIFLYHETPLLLEDCGNSGGPLSLISSVGPSSETRGSYDRRADVGIRLDGETI